MEANQGPARSISYNPGDGPTNEANTRTDSENNRACQPQSLSVVFKETHNVKVLFKRMGMHDEELLKNLMQSREKSSAENGQAEDSDDSAEEGKKKVNFKELEAKRAIVSQLVTF
jgi:hypothetical protein